MYQQHSLDNGLRILMVPMPALQSVTVAVYVKVGSRYETRAQAGISHFIEHMLFKGTTRRPTSRLIAEAIEGIGGVSNAYTSQETTVYYAKVAASRIDTAIDFLIDLIRNPLFQAHDIEKERLVIGEEISMSHDFPDSWVNILADGLLWPDHPLGQNIAGTHDSLSRIDRNMLQSFFSNSYHPQNMLLTISGAFQVEHVINLLTACTGDMALLTPPGYAAVPELQRESRSIVEDRPIEQGHLCLTLPALSRLDSGRYALALLNTILGDGMSSRLFLNIREDKGLAYAVDSNLHFLQDTGSLTIYAGVDPDRAVEALQAILDELEQLCDKPVPSKELQKAKEYTKGRLVLGLEDSYSRAAWVAYQALFLDRIRLPEEVIAAYEAVTASEIQSIAQQIINPDRYNLAVVGPFFGSGDAIIRLV